MSITSSSSTSSSSPPPIITASRVSLLDILMNSLQTSSSTTSTLKTSSSLGRFIFLKTENLTKSSATLKSIIPSSISIKALPVARKGLPKMRGTLVYSSISNTTKSTGNINLSTLTSTSSIIPYGLLMDLSANCSVIIVGVTSPISSLSDIVRGIRFILAPKSHRAFSMATPSMLTGTVKLPGSFNLGGSFLCRIALHSSVSIIVSLSSLNLILLDSISFINLAYAGICSKASEKGMLTSSFLKISRNLANCFSKFFFIKALGKGTLQPTISLGGVLLLLSLAGSADLLLSTTTGLFIVLFSLFLPKFPANVFPLLRVIAEQFSFGFTSVSEGNRSEEH